MSRCPKASRSTISILSTIVKSGTPLASMRDQGRNGRRAWAKYSSTIPVVRAELNYTLDSGMWEHRRWQTIPADLDHDRSTVNVTLPQGVKVYYFNLVDDREIWNATRIHARSGTQRPACMGEVQLDHTCSESGIELHS